MYNEIQLIKELEKEGIGRPSTYSSIVDKLLDKKYIIFGQNPQQEYEIENFIKKYKSDDIIIKKTSINIGGNKKDLLIPTELGINIINYICEIMPYLCDLKFTSKMENDLDDIICAKNKKKVILDNIYEKISNSISLIPSTTILNNKIIKEYNTGLIKTRFGNCYYNKKTNIYTNIDPYLKWKKKNVEKLNEKEIVFLASLPKNVIYLNKSYYLHIGKFGLYLKDENNNNHKLDKKLWKNYIT